MDLVQELTAMKYKLYEEKQAHATMLAVWGIIKETLQNGKKIVLEVKEEIKKGDDFIIINVPNEGVVVYKNGVKKGSIDGHDFKKALFGIWLCDKPADKELKDEMLGK